MPLKLVPPRKGKSPNYSIRGAYLGVSVDKSSGTHRRSVALSKLGDLERQIERGEYPAPETRDDRTFVVAAARYLETPRSKRQRKLVAKLVKYFGETQVDDIDQQAIEDAGIALHPGRTVATRNSSVYTPTISILHGVGIERKFKRPKGAKGRVVTDHLTPADAAAVIAGAASFDKELALLLTFLLYTGVRLSEALGLTWDRLNIDDRMAWVPTSKNGDPRMLRLRDDLAAALQEHRGDGAGRVFRFRQGGHLKHRLMRAKLKALGLPCPTRRPKGWRAPLHRLAFVNFHTFRHTWATWMRQYGGADLQGLVATGNWRDARSAARYAHVVPREEWRRVDVLPGVKVG
jgi:integrase